MTNTLPIENLAFYRFVELESPAEFGQAIERAAQDAGLKGTVLLASEGINAMIAGPREGTEKFASWLRSDARFADLHIKRSYSNRIPFGKLVVKVKPEIVTMRVDGVEATQRTARHLPPEQLRDWLRAGEPIRLIDTRNDYEYQLGTFRGAEDPATGAFHEFPEWVEARREELQNQKVVMFCTGGIRCEKATSWMLDQGIEDIWQLDGGVLNYFERIEDAEQDWEGELFVFDDRVAINTNGEETAASLCPDCGAPVCDCKQNETSER